MIDDILGKALTDYFKKRKNRPRLLIHNKYGDPEVMDPGVYFRKPEEMPQVELFAMSFCKGRVLDVGAGVGAQALPLQQQGVDVTALEISEAACRIMEKRGVKDIQNADFFFYQDKKEFDMLFMMMNGIGFSGSAKGLTATLDKAKTLLKPDGMILFDSSDVSYLYPASRQKVKPYYGELDFQYQYDDLWGPWFKWLYIDQTLMRGLVEPNGWDLQIFYEDGTGHYLGGLRQKL